MGTIYHSIHMVSTRVLGQYYINNYIDQEQYNLIYDLGQEIKGIRQAYNIRDRLLLLKTKEREKVEKEEVVLKRAEDEIEAQKLVD